MPEASENSYALYLPYANQSKEARQSLNDWHDLNAKQLGIDLNENRRKRQGIGGAFMKIPGFFNDDLNYKKIENYTIALIEHQTDTDSTEREIGQDLFQEDVRLVAKDGKLYYLPETTKELA